MRDDGQNVGRMRGKEEVGKARCLEGRRREEGKGVQATNGPRQPLTPPLESLDKPCGRAALPQKGLTPIDKPQYI